LTAPLAPALLQMLAPLICAGAHALHILGRYAEPLRPVRPFVARTVLCGCSEHGSKGIVPNLPCPYCPLSRARTSWHSTTGRVTPDPVAHPGWR
jgi:hypothetical protein